MAFSQTTETLPGLEIASQSPVILKYPYDHFGEPIAQLMPVYENLSNKPLFKNILFLKLKTKERPIQKKLVEKFYIKKRK